MFRGELYLYQECIVIFICPLNRRLLFFFTLLLLFILLSGCVSSNSQAPRKSSTPTPIDFTFPTCRVASCNDPVPGARPFIDTWNNIHLFQSFDYKVEDPASIAKYYDFIWGVRPDKVAAFRSHNSNIFLSYYIPFHRDAGTFTDSDIGKHHDLAYWKSFHADWVLYQCDRVTPAFEYNDPNMPLDFANPAVVTWQVQNYAQPASTRGYDGIAADNVNLENLFGACGYYRNGQWVQRYSGEQNDPQWRQDILIWLTQMQTALHALPHPLALIPNLSVAPVSLNDPIIGEIVSHVDGVFDEGGFTKYGDGYLTDGNWVQTIQFIRSVQNQQQKPYYVSNEFKTDSLNHDQIQWALASYLMCKEHFSSVFITHNIGSEQGYGADSRYLEYEAKIGTPQSEAYFAQNVYWRDYSNGLVVVNPSSTNAYTVNTSASTYVDPYGKRISQTFSIPPHSGMVLIPG